MPQTIDSVTSERDAGQAVTASADALAANLLHLLQGPDVDRPEVWDFVVALGEQAAALLPAFGTFREQPLFWHADLLRAIALATLSRFEEAEAVLSHQLTGRSQSPLVNGAMFKVKQLQNPGDAKFALQNFICETPFRQLDVLDSSSHLCCASWLPVSAGNLHTDTWQNVWNSEPAQNVRRSIHDGSYRYCNKMACPRIMAGTLTPTDQLAQSDEWWKDVVVHKRAVLDRGPAVVNLAYDRTCNLSCPSCRPTVIFQNREQRDRTEAMQERNILPMLEGAENVMVTGSGDPFSSPMFRKLLKAFDPAKYPKLKINLMTNGMLLTEQCWKEYAHLAGHIAKLKFSLDGATAPTHELLRRGSRWERVYENLKFCGRLLQQGALDSFEIVFVVQVENYREMGAFVDLGHDVGADSVYFARITNWGTFTEAEYARKAIFMPTHPEYPEFVRLMQDARLLDPIVMLGDLAPFVRSLR